jgi:asparagine synthase (glutamine-hydrolysing)
MCGIWGFIRLLNNSARNDRFNDTEIAGQFKDFYNLKHRGPDNSYFETYNNVTVGFHRLAIIHDTFSSNQPFILESDTRTIVCLCNGEIYNYKEIIDEFMLPDSIKNDCEIIPHMYQKLDRDTFSNFIKHEVKGEFAFMIFEFDTFKNLRTVLVARDEIGIRPLYYTPTFTDNLFFTSEIKGGLSGIKDDLQEFPPGHIITYSFNELGSISVDINKYSSVYDTEIDLLSSEKDLLGNIQRAVIQSVQRRLNADKPVAFLLSGGVDSSLVAGISARILGKPIRTFCCGMNEGTDLKFARQVAKHIGSTHTEVIFSPEEALAAIPDVIRTIESWDTTTVRASVGQYLVCKWIGLNTDCKVVMVGEGPDEVCSSYLFNWYAPDGDSLDTCAKEYVRNIHLYDVKRADRCISRWGLEGRVALLDPEFIREYWTIPADKRMPTYKGIEKWWLREAFKDTHIIPDEVLWRRKEAFSDGVSGEKSWFQIIQDWIEDKVSDDEMSQAHTTYPFCTPQTKEAYYFRKIFCEIFGEERQPVVPSYWQPKWNSKGQEVTGYIDPSARILDVYGM